MKPDKTFAGAYTVRVGDINYGGHMGNDKALLLFHDARLHFLGQYGFSESNIGGPGLIMSEAHVFFRKEVFRGDELEVFIHIEELHNISFVMHYSIMRDDIEVMYGSTKLVVYDWEKRKVTKVPDAFIKIMDPLHP